MLLDAQRNALLMYTSCGWFFNDLAGIETVQVLRYAARAIDLYEQLGEAPPVDDFLDVLAEARSNDPDAGDGRDLWHDQVWPATEPQRRGAAAGGARGAPDWAQPGARGGAPVACAVVSTQMQTCYRHGDREAGVDLPALRPADLPELHAPGVGGLPLPRVHQAGRPEGRPARQLARGPSSRRSSSPSTSSSSSPASAPGSRPAAEVIYDGGLIGSGFNPFTQESIGVAAGECYRLVTGGFLHANLIHVGFNMLALYQLGQLLEPAFGRVRFLLVYFVSLLGGALGVMLLDPNHLTVGASGRGVRAHGRGAWRCSGPAGSTSWTRASARRSC